MAITFGKVPHPGYIDIQDEMLDKPEGFGWDNLGKRNPKAIVLHRMVGTLAGTRGWFGRPDVPSLTDYGLGIAAVDGKNAGVIHKYNDPLGYRSGWASGPVSAPYGDGAAFVKKYGINAVNRDCISIETSGTNEPMDAFAWGELVKLCAYWIDQMKIPYTALPLNPHTGINVLIWHEEFTYGTKKRCPFQWLKDNTNRLYADIAAYLKPIQEASIIAPAPAPKPVPVPPPTYAAPAPVTELALVSPSDEDTVEALRLVNGTEFKFVGDRVKAKQQTKRLRYAYATSPTIGPDIASGEEFEVLWLFKADDGNYYYYTPYHSRILAKHTTRIKD